MTLSAAAQDDWDYNVLDAQSAYLQSDGIERLLLLRMPHKNPPPGTKPGQVFVATGSICGTRDAGRASYEHSKKVLEAAGLEQGLYYPHGLSGLQAVAHTHVDDFLVAFKKDSKTFQGCFATSHARASFETTFRLGCVLRKNHLQRWQSHQGDTNQVNDEPRMYEHRSGLTNSGKPTHERWDHWIPTRVGTVVVVGTTVSARPVCWRVSGGSETEQGDALRCQSVEQTCRAGEKHCGVVNLETCSVVCYADAGFANAEGVKSQCGLVVWSHSSSCKYHT